MKNVLHMFAVATLAIASAIVLSVAAPRAASGAAHATEAAAVPPPSAAANRDAQCQIARSSSATA